MENNPIVEELQALAGMDWNPNQKAYFERMAADAKPVQCVSVRDVFTADEIRQIKRVLRPKKTPMLQERRVAY